MTEKKKPTKIEIKVSEVSPEYEREILVDGSRGRVIVQELAKLDLIESILSDISFNTDKTVCPHCGVTQYESFDEHKASKALEGIVGRIKQIRKAKEASLITATEKSQ